VPGAPVVPRAGCRPVPGGWVETGRPGRGGSRRPGRWGHRHELAGGTAIRCRQGASAPALSTTGLETDSVSAHARRARGWPRGERPRDGV